MTTSTLAELMATNPDGTLEKIAAEYQVALIDVIKHLPEKTILSGQHFDKIWDEVVKWGEVTILVNSPDIIFEYQGKLPSGFHRHGYFNLRSNKGLGGHIKAENCTHIVLIERPFMGTATASIIFLNQAEQAMFKIFVGRDEHRNLQPEQLEAFRQLTKIK